MNGYGIHSLLTSLLCIAVASSSVNDSTCYHVIQLWRQKTLSFVVTCERTLRSANLIIFLQHICFVESIKPSDMVYSVFSSICETLAQTSYLSAMCTGSRNIFFTGSFINIRLARQIITTELEGRNLTKPEVYFLFNILINKFKRITVH